jgi:hypothetical protein
VLTSVSLAWHELRLLIANLFWHYDVEMTPKNPDWANQRNFLTWEKKPLMVKLSPARENVPN